jgi:hypothetical protein
MTCEFISWYVHYWTNTRHELRSLNCLLEHRLFEPEKGEGQMWGQRSSCYAAMDGTQLLAKIHQLQLSIDGVGCLQHHRLAKHVDFVGDASDRVGRVVDELNNCIDMQDIQINQLANVVSELVGEVEGQKKGLDVCKKSIEEHCKVISNLTTKLMMLDNHVRDFQQKVFPQVGGKWPNC